MSEALPFDPTITIRAETSQADPDTCTFAVSRMVHPGGPFLFDSKDRASGSPLVERLFTLPGVSHVLVAETVVTVGKDSSVAWSALKSAIGAVIRTQLLTGVPRSSRLLAAQAGEGGPTLRFARPFKNCWTGKSTAPSRATAERSRWSTFETETYSSP